MSDKEFRKDILKESENFNGDIEINRTLSYIAVGDFFTQGKPAIDLINEIDSVVQKFNVSEKEAAIFIVANI